MGVVRFEPAPTDVCFAVIMCGAAVTGRFRLSRVPALLRWLVALLLMVFLPSGIVGLLRDLSGSYALPFYGCIALELLAAALIMIRGRKSAP